MPPERFVEEVEVERPRYCISRDVIFAYDVIQKSSCFYCACVNELIRSSAHAHKLSSERIIYSLAKINDNARIRTLDLWVG